MQKSIELSLYIHTIRFFLYREVEMAHKVLAKDMSDLVSAMKLAQQYSDTTLDLEYRKYVHLHIAMALILLFEIR